MPVVVDGPGFNGSTALVVVRLDVVFRFLGNRSSVTPERERLLEFQPDIYKRKS